MESVARAWLAQQCALIPGVARAVLMLRSPGSGAAPPAMASWPEGAAVTADLTAAANAALAQGRVVTKARPGEAGAAPGPSQIGVPFRLASGLSGALALEITKAPPPDARALAEFVRFGATWIEVLARRDAAQGRLVAVLELAGVALEQQGLQAAATAVATELAARLGFERVSVGFVSRGRMRVQALSHSAKFDEKANLVRDLAAAMDEASDQDATVVHPDPDPRHPRVTRAHERLASQRRVGAVCTVPLAHGERVVGAITFERPAGQGLDADAVRLCEDLAALIGPILELKRTVHAGILERLVEFVRVQRTHLFGPGHVKLKLGVLAAAGLLLALLFTNADYRVTADATLEGRVQRAIVAGLEGYIAEANTRAGDLVRQGQVLGRLDDRDLVLERRKWLARREQLRKEHREALAGHDRTQVNILSAKLAQAEAQLALLGEQVARTRLLAPFDGIVVEGDLSQSLGSPVERGDVLFAVAPLDGYRIILKVDERDVSHVASGKPGELVLSSMPGSALPLTVERVIPVTTSEDGLNYFRVEARLDQPSDSLRPGMEGVAKVEVGPRRLLWIWTHGLVDWLRLWAWSWWP